MLGISVGSGVGATVGATVSVGSGSLTGSPLIQGTIKNIIKHANPAAATTIAAILSIGPILTLELLLLLEDPLPRPLLFQLF